MCHILSRLDPARTSGDIAKGAGSRLSLMGSRRAIGRPAAGVFLAGLVAIGLGPSLVLRPEVGADFQVELHAPRSATFILDCTAEARPISQLIYGIGGSADPWATGTTARRWGGNPTTRYNWELDTWNLASDWYFKNTGGESPGSGIERFLTENLTRQVKSALTLPIMGWVAKDALSYSFPVSVYGPQKSTAFDLPDAGNGVTPDGKTIPPGPPMRTSGRSTPESIERLVRKIRESDRTRGRSVDTYILDNEPMLWNHTHRDVHPEATTYDELLEKTIAYGSAIRRADPEARIAGPAEWGWLAYHYSAKDVVSGVFLRPDRRQHGDEPLIPWYLRELREHQRRTGNRILDILDVHFYPMGDGIRTATGGETDPATSSRRLRATRGLWDPTYLDESWINERIQVVPLLREWIARNYPGLGISIGEWDFGAETHMSGGLAIAEVLGRFGVLGLTSAYKWGSPVEKSPGFWAFRAYRNFDGQGGRFQDRSVPVVPVKDGGQLVSLFGSRDAGRERLVAVLLNLAPLSRLSAHIGLQGCGRVASTRGFTYAGGDQGFSDLQIGLSKDVLHVAVAPYSITVVDLGTEPQQIGREPR